MYCHWEMQKVQRVLKEGKWQKTILIGKQKEAIYTEIQDLIREIDVYGEIGVQNNRFFAVLFGERMNLISEFGASYFLLLFSVTTQHESSLHSTCSVSTRLRSMGRR